jgi:hypothetical protein
MLFAQVTSELILSNYKTIFKESRIEDYFSDSKWFLEKITEKVSQL